MTQKKVWVSTSHFISYCYVVRCQIGLSKNLEARESVVFGSF
jgi:hypothetical protein